MYRQHELDIQHRRVGRVLFETDTTGPVVHPGRTGRESRGGRVRYRGRMAAKEKRCRVHGGQEAWLIVTAVRGSA